MKNSIEKLSNFMNTSREERRRERLEKLHAEDVELGNRLKDKLKDLVVDSDDFKQEGKGNLAEYDSLISKANYYVREIDLINRELNIPMSSGTNSTRYNAGKESLIKTLENKRNSVVKILNKLKLNEKLSIVGEKPEVIFEEYIKRDENERREEWLNLVLTKND